MFNRTIVEKQVIYFVYRWENRKFNDDLEFMYENLSEWYIDDVVLVSNFYLNFVLILNWWYKTLMGNIVRPWPLIAHPCYQVLDQGISNINSRATPIARCAKQQEKDWKWHRSGNIGDVFGNLTPCFRQNRLKNLELLGPK